MDVCDSTDFQRRNGDVKRARGWRRRPGPAGWQSGGKKEEVQEKVGQVKEREDAKGGATTEGWNERRQFLSWWTVEAREEVSL